MNATLRLRLSARTRRAGAACLLLLAAGCAHDSLAPPLAPALATTGFGAGAPASAPASSATGASTLDRGDRGEIHLPPTAAGLVPADPAGSAEADPPVLPPYDPLQPEAPVDLADRSAHTDLWGRVRHGFAIPDMDTPQVREWEQFYANKPDYVARMTARGSRYLFHIVEEVERRHMPTELALLPFTESAFNPQALSVAKASGMWQFVPSTGRNFDLKQNVFRDDRRDVLASTRAALDYLDKLHGMFGDWQLALAAYNWGEGNLARAVARNQKTGRPTDYLSLNMPAETRGYYPKLQAVKNIVLKPQAFGLGLPPLENHPYFLSVPIERDMDVDVAARLAGITPDEFRMLNPQMNRPVILAAGTPQVLLPYDAADEFVRNVENHRGPLASWTAWVATRTLRPADAAKQVGMSEAELREINHIPGSMLVKAGSTLLVPRSAQHGVDVSEHVADSAALMLAPDLPPTRRMNLRVGRGGETVASVARRWRLSPAQVAAWNHAETGTRFKAGTTVVLFLPRSAGTRTASRATTPAVAQGRPQRAQTASASHATRATARTRVASTSSHRHATTTSAAKGRKKTVAQKQDKNRVRVAQP